MAYEGEQLLFCPAEVDFTTTYAVVVSGASWNPCGHMILCCGTATTNHWYFHVAGQGTGELGGVRAYPKFMKGDSNYYRYLSENHKHEIRRLNTEIRHPAAAYRKLDELMVKVWWWGILIHNCASFVTDIINAGGGNINVVLNCPDQEFLQRINFFNRIVREVEEGAEDIERKMEWDLLHLPY